MNKVILMGRLTRDPEVRYSQGDNAMAIARYTLAVAIFALTTTANSYLFMLVTSFWSLAHISHMSKE